MSQFFCLALAAVGGALIAWWFKGRGARAELEENDAAWRRRLDGSQRDLESRQLRVVGIEGERDALLARIKVAADDVAQLRAQVMAFERSEQSLRVAGDEKARIIRSMRGETDGLANGVATLRGDLNSTVSSIATLEHSLLDTRGARDAFERQLGEARGQVLNHQRDYTDLLGRFRLLEPLTGQLKQRDDELVGLRSRLTMAERQAGETDGVVSILRRKVVELEVLPAQLRARDDQIAGMRSRVAELEPLPARLCACNARRRSWMCCARSSDDANSGMPNCRASTRPALPRSWRAMMSYG